MRLKSRGLGRKELVMDFREYDVVVEGDEIVIVGTIHEPVHWDFSIRVCEDDLAGIINVALKKPTRRFALRAVFRRDKRHHWNSDRGRRIVLSREHALDLARKEAREALAEDLEKDAVEAAVEADKRVGKAKKRLAKAAKKYAAKEEPAAAVVASGAQDAPEDLSDVDSGAA